MRLRKCALFCAVLALCILEPITARRSFGARGGSHSYPKSGGLSGGGGGHHYPSSGGLSGGSHGYPSSGGHGYPSSGGLSGHGTGNRYPSSGSNQGYPSSGNNHGYPSSGNNHGYPSSGGGLSGTGSHGYPSGGGLSGGGSHGYPQKAPTYHYTPPKQIVYTPSHGAPVHYPVYHGSPPTYVYKYKNSGSKYGTLLAGLALLNLGTLGAAAYAVHNSNSNHGSSGSYKSQPGEVCKLGIKKDNGDYEETRIDCQLISSFIFQAEAEDSKKAQNNSTVITTTTVTNVTTVNGNTNGTMETSPEPAPEILYKMLANGTLVPVNGTMPVNTTAAQEVPTNNATSVVTTTTVTNTTVQNAVDVKGDPVKVTDGMKCIIMRTTPVSSMRKTIPCGVLQQYAAQSLKKNSASRAVPAFTIVTVLFAVFIMH